jgi:hypothetical protein
LPLFLFVKAFQFMRLNLTDDHVPAVYITFHFLLAARDPGFGALSHHLAVIVAIPAFRNCCGWNFCLFKSIDHVAGKSGAAVLDVLKR